MAQPNQGKASKLVDQLMSRSLTEEEAARQKPKVPELRLRADAPAVKVNETTTIGDVLAGVHNEQSSAVIVRGPDGAPAAVVTSVDRYLDLVGKELATTAQRIATLDGRLIPNEVELAASHVEQVDPADAWTHTRPELM